MLLVGIFKLLSALERSRQGHIKSFGSMEIVLYFKEEGRAALCFGKLVMVRKGQSIGIRFSVSEGVIH